MKSLAIIINARLESSRCPNKHIRDMGGTTMIDECLKKVERIVGVKEKYLAVFEPELFDKLTNYTTISLLKRKYDAVKYGQAPYNVAFRHYANVSSDYILTINPCQPFVSLQVYQDAVDKFKELDCDGAISVVVERTFFFFEDFGRANFKCGDKLSSQFGPAMLRCSHTFFIFKKDYFINHGEIWPNVDGNPYPFIILNKDLFDVNTEDDFIIARELMKHRNS